MSLVFIIKELKLKREAWGAIIQNAWRSPHGCRNVGQLLSFHLMHAKCEANETLSTEIKTDCFMSSVFV